MTNYDLVIIGEGPAGLAASIYASRYKINHVVIGYLPGGLISEAHKVCNYPGFEDISGMELANKFRQHAKSLGMKEISDLVIDIKKTNNDFEIVTQGKKELVARAIILAIGTVRKKLNAKGEDKLLGRGVSYCATCDGMFYKDKIVAVVGGSDSATTAALMLSKIAQKVYIIYRRDKLRGDATWVEQVHNAPNIKTIFNTNVVEFVGEQKLEKVKLDNGNELSLDGVFIEIGSTPDIQLAQKLEIKTNEGGYIIVNNDQSTSVKGVYAAGDITTASNKFRQVITAAAEGAIAAVSIQRYLSQLNQDN